MKSLEIAYVILSFVLMATFISIFFFTYVSSVEADIIKSQISDTISEFVSSANVVLTPQQKSVIGNMINNDLNVPDMSEDDREAENTNNSLIKKSAIVFGSLVGGGIVVIFLLYFFYGKFDIGLMLKYSLVMVGVIALTEFLFVTLVTKNYRLIDPNYLSYLVVSNLEIYANM